MGWFEISVNKQRSFIEDLLSGPMCEIAGICALNWNNRARLGIELKCYIQRNTDFRCRLLYAIDKQGRQHSSNISDIIVDDTRVGQDLSHRPYLGSFDTGNSTKLVLSEVYIDKQTRKPCITALHGISLNNELIGYIAADFGLNDLSLKNVHEVQPHEWRQVKGDPSIRGTLFQQTRSLSTMDEHLDEVLDVVESLITEQGIFHANLHFSSSCATLWSSNDPCRYRLHVLDEIVNPKVCLAYEKTPYPKQAATPDNLVHNVLKAFKLLREADETIYLRAASLNIMNGLVGLNFSCDGSHYMQADEFLEKDLAFWLGENAICVNA